MPAPIDEDQITTAVIACHAGAENERLRDVMTSLVQHLHAFVREVRPSDAEWRAGLRFLAETGRASPGAHDPEREFAALSEALGLSALVGALNRPRRGAGTSAGVDGAAPLTFTPAPQARGPVAELLRALGRTA